MERPPPRRNYESFLLRSSRSSLPCRRRRWRTPKTAASSGAFGDLDEGFALVLAVEHPDECPRGVCEALRDVLAPTDVPVRHPVRKPEGSFVITVRVVEDEEAFHACTEDDQQARM